MVSDKVFTFPALLNTVAVITDCHVVLCHPCANTSCKGCICNILD